MGSALILSVLQLAAGLGVLAGNQMARWAGVGLLALNLIAQMFFLPAYPFWSLTIIAVDVVALWGLCVYGSRENLEAAYAAVDGPEVNHYDAIKTGLMLTPATIGILVTSAGAERFARRHPQRWLIIAGFATTAVGMILLLALVRANSGILTWVPGLLLFGAGVGVMLTSSVNVVQSSFPEADQGDISGLSRSVSNLGSSLGTALVGTVLVAVARPAGQPFAVALAIMLVLALIGLVIGVLIPRQSTEAEQQTDPSTAAAR